MADEFVEVLDIEVVTATVALRHTVRAHEGDVLEEFEDGGFRIRHGEKEVKLPSGEKRKVPGLDVKIYGDKIVQMSRETRCEPRVRPSVAALKNREKAEVERLANKLGVADALKP